MNFEDWIRHMVWDHYTGFAYEDVKEAWEAGYAQAKKEEEAKLENKEND